jgi:hypothetical protein
MRASDDGSDGPPDVDEQELLAEIEAYRDHLVQISTEPETSETHSDAASVLVWGSPEAADRFLGIDPMDPTQELHFEEGTMFVKEQFDEAGALVGLTAMLKAPAGYDDGGGDWFWARVWGTDVTHEGRVSWCRNCHEAAQNTDFVVGFAKSP